MTSPHDWRDLQIALALREHGSLSKVAAALHLSPSTVSRRLDSLEAQIGSPLFDRHTTGYTLREEGAYLLDALGPMSDFVHEWQRRLAHRHEASLQSVTLTAPALLLMQIGPVVPLFLQRFPGRRLVLLEEDRVEELHKSEADIALRVMRAPDEDLWGHLIGEIEFVIAGSPAYVESARELDAVHWVAMGGEGTSRTPVGRWEREHIRPWQHKVEVHSRHVHLAMLREGCGLGLVPRYIVERDPDLAIHSIPRGIEPLKIWVLAHPGIRTREEIAPIMKFLAEHGRRLLRSSPAEQHSV